MIDFYALTSPNVQKIFIMLEETELAYKPIYVDVWKGDNFTPEFKKLNPNAKIPVIVDHEGPGGKPFTVFESGAILMYLAEKSGKFLPKDAAQRFTALQWLMIQVTGIGPMFGQLVHFKRFAPAGNDYSLSRYQTEVKRLYDVLETRLGRGGLSRRTGLHHCRHSDFSVDARPRHDGRQMGRPPELRALVRGDRGAAGGEARVRQDRDHPLGARDRQARGHGPLLRPGQVRPRLRRHRGRRQGIQRASTPPSERATRTALAVSGTGNHQPARLIE